MVIKNSKSRNVFLGIVLVMVLIKIFDIVFNPNKVFPGRTAVFSWFELVLVLILGIVGLYFYDKIGFPDFLNKGLSKKIISCIVLAGLGFGVLFVSFDSVARIGDISVGWPLSVVFYIWGAISTEVLFRLFAVTFLVWLFGNLISKKRYNDGIYLGFSILLSFVGMMSMLMAFSNPDIPLSRPGNLMFALLGLLVFSGEYVSFWLMKRYGFLSNLIFRLSFYSIWHVLWPIVFY